MYNFKIDFSVSPWVFLLLIPLFAFALFMYFRMKKKYRRTRNRILSLVLHCLVILLCVGILSGMTFSYDMPNEQNELVILVDASFSSGYAKERANNFVHEILVSNENRCRVSIVTFGFDQQVALEMGEHDPEKAYQTYLEAPLPDITATDIASALTYVWDPANDQSGGEDGKAIISHPETSKIVLISDGLETDRDAMNVVKGITMDGVEIDASFYPANYKGDVWITNVTYPDRKYNVGEEIPFVLEVRSAFEGELDITLTDKTENDVKTVEKKGVQLASSSQTFGFPYTFETPGHHELCFEIESSVDTMPENNLWNLSYDIDEFSSILIIEKYKGESLQLISSLTGSAVGVNIDFHVVQVDETAALPSDIKTLVAFDEVILVNIANSDMPESFVKMLESYVGDYGGGVFTVGGVEKDESGNVVTVQNEKGETVPKAHAYNKDDMQGSLFGQMLPVEITDYTPSVALAIIIDRSGSMETDSEYGMPVNIAISGAIDALEALSPHDQVGIVTLQDHYTFGLDMTPMTQKNRIINSIRNVVNDSGGGTMYEPAIEMAGQTLQSLLSAERKHILFFSDSMPADLYSSYGAAMQRFYKNYGITITYVSVVRPVTDDLKNLAENAGGHAYYMDGSDIGKISDYLAEDLQLDGLSGAVPEQYSPTIQNHTTIVDGVTDDALKEITMDGFFTSVEKGYGDVEVSLRAQYVPLYAQWKYGRGKVGSFLCDLENYWSEEFLESTAGKKVLYNIMSTVISKMTYSENVFSTTVIEDNYRTQISVYGFHLQEEEGKKLIAFVNGPNDEPQKFDLSEESFSGNRFTFLNKTQGVYEITIAKVPIDFGIDGANSLAEIPSGSLYGYYRTFRAFSYSREYDPASDSFADGRTLLVDLSTREIEEGEDPTQKLVYDAESILDYFADIHIVYDPQKLFAILAIVFMLLDIAVRKFKFKWPHEIVRTYRQRKTQFGEGAK